MNLPKIESYGQYKSGNYGVNSLSVSFPNGFTLYYSYETIIAYRGNNGLIVRQNSWSTTTGKHLNWIDGGRKEDRIKGTQFEAVLNDELKLRGLSPIEEGEHVHEWGTPKEAGGEIIFWCKHCEATIDSDGGIIQ